MVNSIKAIAAQSGAACYADPFLATTDDSVEESTLTRAMGWLAADRRQVSQLARERPPRVNAPGAKSRCKGIGVA